MLTACAAAPEPTGFTIGAGRYDEAFNAAKDVLREFEFELERVDARSGIISTAPRASSGAATPWIPHAASARDALEGLLQFEQRVARIQFTHEGPHPVLGDDIRVVQSPVRAEVIVQVERFHRPGRRFDPSGIRLQSRWIDPSVLTSASQTGWHIDNAGMDQPLAARIAAALGRRVPTLADASESTNQVR